MIGLLYSRLRQEENLLLEAAKARSIPIDPIWDEDLVLDLDHAPPGDVLLCRSLSTWRGLYALRAARALGRPSINTLETASICMDKTETSLRLRQAGVPTPDVRVAFSSQGALKALDELGYPAVIKPTLGSWARLIARVDDRQDAEQILEHREALPNALHHIHYIQRYVEKSGADGHRDLRAFVIGDQTVAAVWRTSPHWITNTARGAKTSACPIDDALGDLCARAAEAVGGGVLAIDLMETPDGLTVHEVNHTMEFRNSIAPTGIDIPGLIVEHCQREARA